MNCLSCCIVGLVTRLWAGQFGVQFLAGARDFSHLQKCLRPALGLTLHHTGCMSVFLPGGVMLITHLHLVLRFSISGAVPLLLLCAFMTCTRTAVSFTALKTLYKGGHYMLFSMFFSLICAVCFTNLLIITFQDSQCSRKPCNRHLVPQIKHWSPNPTGCLNP
jgi:hypothetical protein